MKRSVCLIIALCMMISAVPALAEEAVKTDDWLRFDSFLVEKNGDEYSIVGIADNIGTDEVTLPETLRGWVYDKRGKVEHLSDDSYTIMPEAFKNYIGIRKIAFEEGIKIIPRALCDGMTYLEEVVLPKSLTHIDNEAFRGCNNLKKIDLSNVEHIGRSAFEGCTSLEKITLSWKTDTIEAYAFYGCEKLEEAAMLHSGVAVGQNAFEGTKVDATKREEVPEALNKIDYIYPARDVFRSSSPVVELLADAVVNLPVGDDTESKKYDFITTDAVTIKKVMDVLKSCRYKEVTGAFASEGTAFYIQVKFADGAEAQMTFTQSTTRIDTKKYQLEGSDYWRLAECLRSVKSGITANEKLFNDVTKSSEYAEAVECLTKLGIMAGYGITPLSLTIP